MQKRIMIPLLAVTASLLMIALFAVFLFFFGAGAANSSESPEPSQPAYVLREYDGKLGVFPADSDTPQEVIDVPISLLPPYNRYTYSQVCRRRMTLNCPGCWKITHPDRNITLPVSEHHSFFYPDYSTIPPHFKHRFLKINKFLCFPQKIRNKSYQIR